MKNDIIPVRIPKEGVSDSSYLVTEILFHDGDLVSSGEVILTVETSKTVLEIVSPASGYVFYNVQEGQDVTVGNICAAVCPSPELPLGYFLGQEGSSDDSPFGLAEGGEPHISSAAMKLIRANGIDVAVFAGKPKVRTEDVKNYLKNRTTSPSLVNIEDDGTPDRMIVIGGGGHAKMCIDMIRQMHRFNIVGIIDEHRALGSRTLGVPVIGRDQDLEKLYNKGILLAVIGLAALGQPQKRKQIYERLTQIGFNIPNLIHPRAVIEPTADIGDGNQIMAGAIVGSEVKLGHNCIVNSGAIISHESILKDNVHVTPGAIIAGSVKIGENTIIGMGASVYLGIEIGDNVVIPNGMDVLLNIPDGMRPKQ